MITGDFFSMNKKNSVKNGLLKSRNLSEKKPTRSTNILLLLLRKSEQKHSNMLSGSRNAQS